MSSSESIQRRPTVLPPGTRLGRWVLDEILGVGGMGVVYRAVGDGVGAVALKVLNAARTDDPQRFDREARIAEKVDHPHVARVLSHGLDDDRRWIAMELIDGETLAEHIARRGALSPADTAALMIPVIEAVSAAHARGVVHRDLKPENILLGRSPDGALRPVVVDFGVARVMSPDSAAALGGRTESAALLGTAAYMAPEQIQRSRDADERSDQYALGAVLYACLTGRAPFTGGSVYELAFRVVGGAFDPPRALRPELPEDLDRAVLRAMASEPSARFERLDALVAVLRPFAPVAPFAPAVAAPPSAPPTPTRSRRAAFGLVTLVCCAAAVVGVVRLRPRLVRTVTAPIAAAASPANLGPPAPPSPNAQRSAPQPPPSIAAPPRPVAPAAPAQRRVTPPPQQSQPRVANTAEPSAGSSPRRGANNAWIIH